MHVGGIETPRLSVTSIQMKTMVGGGNNYELEWFLRGNRGMRSKLNEWKINRTNLKPIEEGLVSKGERNFWFRKKLI